MTGSPVRYVAIGDSLSEGVGDETRPDGSHRGWTDRLAAMLAQDRPVAYANLAIRGRTARQVVEEQLEPAVALRPTLASISAGTNDLLRPRVDLARLADDLSRMADALTGAGATVIFVPVPAVERVTRVARPLAARRRRLNAIIDAIAQRPGVLVPPDTTGSVFEDVRAWAPDKLHLSALGHERLARGYAEMLGVAPEGDWRLPPPGVARRAGWTDEAGWLLREAGPWVGRRVTGRSSGDGRTAKRPTLAAWSEPV